LCADVTSLYTNIPTKEGIAAVRAICRKLSDLPPKELDFILDLMELVLRNNYLEFDGKIYLQIQGVDMGQPLAVTYANLFLASIELPILTIIPSLLLRDDTSISQPMKFDYYFRFIDDIFARGTKTAFSYFLAQFCKQYPSINLDGVTTGISGIFLDLRITLQPSTDAITTLATTVVPALLVPISALANEYRIEVYQKPINKYQYIPIFSNHNPSVFPSWVFSELKRYRLYSTEKADFDSIAAAFQLRLQARGYPCSIFDSAMAKLPTREQLLTALRGKSTDSTVSKATPGPALFIRLPPFRQTDSVKKLKALVRQLPDHLASHPNYKYIWSITLPRVQFTNGPNISQHLTRSKFSTPDVVKPEENEYLY